MKIFRTIITLFVVVSVFCAVSVSAFADYQSDVALTSTTDSSAFDLYYEQEHHYVPYGTTVSRTYQPTHYTVWYLQGGLSDYSEYYYYLAMNPQGIDGSFGANTESAVKAFQTHCGITSDGWVGNITWGKLESCLNNIN